MRDHHRHAVRERLTRIGGLAILVAAPACARAQTLEGAARPTPAATTAAVRDGRQPVAIEPEHSHSEDTFRSRADSLSWARARKLARDATGLRLVVSLRDRRLWAITGDDTLLSAPVAVAKGTTLEYAGHAWTFSTPRGMRTVLSKESDPIWQPPDWLYAETAAENGLKLGRVFAGHPIKLRDGRRLAVRDSLVGLIDDGVFAALPTDEHIVFDNTLFIPPMGSRNRRIEGALGRYRLNLGEGYLLHGTPYQDSIGMAATHGCVRLRDEDIEWLFENVPVGTKVYIY
jgi:L,D-transpeptidase catalytic domain